MNSSELPKEIRDYLQIKDDIKLTPQQVETLRKMTLIAKALDNLKKSNEQTK